MAALKEALSTAKRLHPKALNGLVWVLRNACTQGFHECRGVDKRLKLLILYIDNMNTNNERYARIERSKEGEDHHLKLVA